MLLNTRGNTTQPPRSTRQKCRAERAALEAAYNLSSVHTGADYERFVANILIGTNIPTVRVGQSGDYAAFTAQARKAARQLNVTLANHAEIAALLG